MNRARRDLCGGCAAMRIPTAIIDQAVEDRVERRSSCAMTMLERLLNAKMLRWN